MQPVERAEYEGVDYAWVMQTTFVVTILVGAPVAALLSTLVTLETWGARAAFAVQVGAPIWFVTAVAVALYARRTEAGDGGGESGDVDGDAETADSDDEPDDTDDATEPATSEPEAGDLSDDTPTETGRDD